MVATRLQTNCSEETFQAKRITEYKSYLADQSFPSKSVENRFAKASTISKSDLLKIRKNYMYQEIIFLLLRVVSNEKEVDAIFVKISLLNQSFLSF